jgi:hypothetical protein
MPEVSAPTSRFLLHCDTTQSIYTVTSEGARWRRAFQSLAEALQFAAQAATSETELLLFSEFGNVVAEWKLQPKP